MDKNLRQCAVMSSQILFILIVDKAAWYNLINDIQKEQILDEGWRRSLVICRRSFINES